jgi:hypothetical protein
VGSCGCSCVGSRHFKMVASFNQITYLQAHVIPAKARIHPAILCGRNAYDLDSRFRGNDVWAVTSEAANDATT